MNKKIEGKKSFKKFCNEKDAEGVAAAKVKKI